MSDPSIDARVRPSAGSPIEAPRFAIARTTTLIADAARDGRLLGVDVWYPAASARADRSVYQLMPGIEFESAAAQPAGPAHGGSFPLVLFSHGRTGMRFSNSLLCETLAARGAIVVSAEHPGDALADWLLGTYVDDRTNEMGRVADANLLLDALLKGHPSFAPDVTAAIDHNRVVMAGHSYGAYTALATVAGRRGVAPHSAVKAVVSFQGYTRTLSDAALARVTLPTLLVVGECDRSTPASSDADRPWQLLAGSPTWRADMAGAGHQASSDMGLYADLVDHIPYLPEQVKTFFAETVVDAIGPGLRPWRELLIEQIGTTWAFLTEVLELHDPDAPAELDQIIASGGLRLQRR